MSEDDRYSPNPPPISQAKMFRDLMRRPRLRIRRCRCGAMVVSDTHGVCWMCLMRESILGVELYQDEMLRLFAPDGPVIAKENVNG